jgi:hypothetical protein
MATLTANEAMSAMTPEATAIAATLTIEQAQSILAQPNLMYGMAAGEKKGTIIMSLMTDVGKGNGFMGGRWKLETVATGKKSEANTMEAEMSRLNRAISTKKQAARLVLIKAGLYEG